MNNIDTSFLMKPEPEKTNAPYNGQGWGYLDPNNESVFNCWKQIFDIIKAPKTITEVGFFAGHSATTMMSLWPKSKLTSYDPGSFARKAYHAVASKFEHQFKFIPYSLNEAANVPTVADLLFIDGSHSYDKVVIDISYIDIIKPKYVVFDNIELQDVRRAFKEAGYMKKDMNPKYFFYTCAHKGSIAPGIMALIKI